MPILAKTINMAFFPVPKNAGTAARAAMFEIENGYAYRPMHINGRIFELSDFYPALPFMPEIFRGTEGLTKVAIVRDPISRFISAYRNRVVHFQEIAKENFAKRALPESLPKAPDINVFVAHLESYRKILSIAHHTDPQSVYLGPDLNAYDKIYAFESLDQFEQELRRRSGRPIVWERQQAGGPEIARDALSPASIAALRQFYRPDYELLRNYPEYTSEDPRLSVNRHG